MKTLLVPQRDFSGGQINEAARRRDDADIFRAGLRRAENWRITNTGQIEPRPGRKAIFFPEGPRVEKLRVSTGEEFYISFAAGAIYLHNMDGGTAASSASAGYLWTADTVAKIVWCQVQDDIYITFPGGRPNVIKWNRNTKRWSFSTFAFASSGAAVKQPYYRFSAIGATMTYSAVSGSISLICDTDYFASSMIGSTLSIVGQQVTITAVADSKHATATTTYRLPDAVNIPVHDTTPFKVGQIASCTKQNLKIEIGAVSAASGPGTVSGILLSNIIFDATIYTTTDDVLVSPVGSSKFTAAATLGSLPMATVQWQEEFMSDLRGWPASCFYDRGRLGFCDFPQALNAIAWSAIAAPDTFWVDSVAAATQPDAGASANSAIVELMKGAPRARYVVGWQQGQFVFTDRGVFYVPISNQSPLIPGSVEFDQISNDGVGPIVPLAMQDAIVFINAGQKRCSAIRATGTYTRPFIVEDVSDAHTDLFKTPVCLTIATGDGAYPERYAYVLNADGSIVVGKFTADKAFVGWLPWTSNVEASVKWVSAWGPNVFYSCAYPAGYSFEVETDGVWLDGAIYLNALTSGTTPPTGKGPFWLAAGGTISLMDGNRDLGDVMVDTSGNLVADPSFDLSSPTLYGGIFQPAICNPFVPGAQAGESFGQRMRRRNLARVAVNVEDATDFTLGKRIFSVQRFGDDGDAQPVLMNASFRVRFLGVNFDPTVDFIKHRPGPLRLCELTIEVTP